MQPFEIRADGVDSSALAADLAARAAARPPLSLPDASLDLPPPMPADRRAQLGAWLDRARRLATRLSVDPNVGWRTPVLGPLWNVLRRVVYRDLRLYADAVASKQMAYNEAVVSVLEILTERLAALEATPRRQPDEQGDEPEPTIERLRAAEALLARGDAEVRAALERLGDRLAALEERQPGPPPGLAPPGPAPHTGTER